MSLNDTAAGQTLDFASNFPVVVVFVKGGPDSNTYDYSPNGVTGDTGLHAPLNEDGSGKWYGLSHITFCFKVDLLVSKTATTTFTRDFDRTIEKSADRSTLALAPGQRDAHARG